MLTAEAQVRTGRPSRHSRGDQETHEGDLGESCHGGSGPFGSLTTRARAAVLNRFDHARRAETGATEPLVITPCSTSEQLIRTHLVSHFGQRVN